MRCCTVGQVYPFCHGTPQASVGGCQAGGALSKVFWQHSEGCRSNQSLKAGVSGLPLMAGASSQGGGAFQATECQQMSS